MSALTVEFRYSLTIIHHPDLSSDYTSPQTNGNTGAINPKVMDEMSGETRPLTSRSRSIHSEFDIRAFIEGVAFLKSSCIAGVGCLSVCLSGIYACMYVCMHRRNADGVFVDSR